MGLLELIVVVVLLLWLLGLGTGYTIGGLLHVLIVIAVVLIVVKLLRGQPPV